MRTKFPFKNSVFQRVLPSNMLHHLGIFTGKAASAVPNGSKAELPLQYTPDGRLAKPTKLSLVVTDAVRRWYLETEKEAERGDVVSVVVYVEYSLFNNELKKKHIFHRLIFVFTQTVQKAQALLGQMLIEGYGCEADPVRGRELSEKARRRGYRMQGVYCEI